MILIGQYDSPFVRRVGIALTHYAIGFRHQPLSVFGDGERIRSLNPLMRVPTLVLDDGLVLTDSHMMLDHLDRLVERPLFPRSGMARTRALRRAALACGAAEKAVSLFYERRLHEHASAQWEDRCRLQVGSVLDALESETGGGESWWGTDMGHDDIALACALRFIGEAHPGAFDWTRYPQLIRRAAKMEALPLFAAISQPFKAPA